MIKIVIAFVTGVYIGQEYGKLIPNVKNESVKKYEEFINSDFYKKIKEDTISISISKK
jgi:hypothetical protein